MNQILFTNEKNLKNISFKNNKKYFIIFFIISLILFISFIAYLCFYIYNLTEKEKFAKKLVDSFDVTSLYSNNNSYSAIFTNTKTNLFSEPFVIGVIQIDKINLHYPILSYATEDSLKISPCRFAGPLPNEIGNLCIAGHNYIDNSFFAKINLLSIGDNIKIYDKNGFLLNYSITAKAEVNTSDLSYTSQNTNEKRIITLVTCNSIKDTRIIIVAENNFS